MERLRDYYSVLGVPRDATTAAIKRAYRRLAKRLHPDRGPGSSTQEFQDLQAAYETLADDERRRRYDDSLSFEEGGPLERLAWSFVRGPAAGDLRRPTYPGALSGEIILSASEAAAGGILPLDVPLESTCPQCDGTGGFVFDCASCEGEGRMERRVPVAVRIPAGVRTGAVFQVRVDEPGVRQVLLTVSVA